MEKGERSLEDWEKDLPMNFPENTNYYAAQVNKENNAKMRKEALRDFYFEKVDLRHFTFGMLNTLTFQNYLLYKEKQYLADQNISETQKEKYILKKYQYYYEISRYLSFFKEPLNSELPYPIKIKVLQFLQLYFSPTEEELVEEIVAKLEQVYEKWKQDFQKDKITKNFDNIAKNTEDAKKKIEAIYKEAEPKT